MATHVARALYDKPHVVSYRPRFVVSASGHADVSISAREAGRPQAHPAARPPAAARAAASYSPADHLGTVATIVSRCRKSSTAVVCRCVWVRMGAGSSPTRAAASPPAAHGAPPSLFADMWGGDDSENPHRQPESFSSCPDATPTARPCQAGHHLGLWYVRGHAKRAPTYRPQF